MNASTLDEEAIYHSARHIRVPEARVAYLDLVCGANADLRARVEALLFVCEHDSSFLEGVPAVVPEPPPVSENLGTAIGPYTLREVIGEGGMGMVYVAEQLRPVRRKVALKVIKPGMDTKQVIARFEAERQALALMDHPNIARVLDAGATKSGRPYFVMELVRGLPITEYCDRAHLSVAARLDLFVLVCRAVQHAHQRGIIHRDLKPTNILVTNHDGVPVPKVIDFGVAKATGSALTDQTVYTGFTQLVGTPLYMSPEQAELSGFDVDTRSDIYSLGVLLYELVTGTTPFDSKTLKQAAFDEMRRIIREQEPERPSLRLSALGDTLTDVSSLRATDPRRLNRSVRGELDWIVMKALEKDRRRRYESAGDFAADVMRHLSGHPVEACPPSAWYRFSKYARRNRVWLFTATLVGASLVVGMALSAWQAARANRAASEARSERDTARRAQRQADAVSEFLQRDLLSQVGWEAQDREGFEPDANLTVKAALDRAARRIGPRFQHDPLLEATLRRTIGKAYHSINEEKLAVVQLERAVELSARLLGLDHPDTLDSQYYLAMVYQWTNPLTDAIRLLESIHERSTQSLGPHHLFTLKVLNGLGEACRKAKQLDRALVLVQRALDAKMAVFGPDQSTTQNSIHDLGLIYRDLRQFDKAAPLLEDALRRLSLSCGTDHPDTIYAASNLVEVYKSMGRTADADRLILLTYDQSPAAASPLLDRFSSNLMKQALTDIGEGRLAEAESVLRRCLRLRDIGMPNDPRRFLTMSVLGETLLGECRHEEARPLLLKGYEGIFRNIDRFPTPNPVALPSAAERIARYYEAIGDSANAEHWRRKHPARPRASAANAP